MARLLIVDDEQTICWALAELARSAGHEVRTASSAERGLEIASEEPPDVVVMDIRLPGMDGLTAIERLRDQLGGVPIIVITAHGDLETAVQAVRQDAFEYILKPFDLDQMQRAIDHALLSGQADTRGLEPPADVETGLMGHSPVMQEVLSESRWPRTPRPVCC